MPAIPEPCASCGGRCCNRFAVPITHIDALRLCRRTQMKPEEFCEFEEAGLVSKNPYPFVLIKGEKKEMLLVLRRQKTEHCVFFAKSNGCKVHNARPAVCRTYPFNLYGEFAKERGIGNKRLERLIGMLAPKAKAADLSGTRAAEGIYYTLNTACPRRWEENEFEPAKVIGDLALQGKQIDLYWKVVNEWNAKIAGSRNEFFEFVIERAEEDIGKGEFESD